MACLICPVTDSPSVLRVIRAALLCSRAEGLEMRFVHFGQLSESSAKRLHELIHQETGADHMVDCQPATQRMDAALNALIREFGASLVVLGALQREGALRDLVGSTARRIARAATCSVLLTSTVGKDASGWTRFLASVDDTPDSRGLAETTLRLAAHAAPDAEVVIAREYRAYARQADSVRVFRPGELSPSAINTTEYELSDFVQGLGMAARYARVVALPGRPGQEIARYAEDAKADLLAVLAPPSRLGVLSRLMSHPTMLLLDRLPCSVLLYKQGKNPL